VRGVEDGAAADEDEEDCRSAVQWCDGDGVYAGVMGGGQCHEEGERERDKKEEREGRWTNSLGTEYEMLRKTTELDRIALSAELEPR
jgi:hypothetical protein